MSALQKLLAAKKAQAETTSVEPEYVMKLASACDYAAQLIANKQLADEIEAKHNYTPKANPVEKVASVNSNLLANKLREKLAFKQEQAQQYEVENTRSIVSNIISRFAKSDNVEYTQRGAHYVEVDTPSQLADVEIPQRPEEGKDSVDVVAAMSGTRLSDVLAAAQSANGTSESATAGSTKTAGAQGKGPMAVGAATNRIRARLMSQAGGNK